MQTKAIVLDNHQYTNKATFEKLVCIKVLAVDPRDPSQFGQLKYFASHNPQLDTFKEGNVVNLDVEEVQSGMTTYLKIHSIKLESSKDVVVTFQIS